MTVRTWKTSALALAAGAFLFAPLNADDWAPTAVGNRFLQTQTPLVNDAGTFEVAVTHRFNQSIIESGGGGAFGLDSGSSTGIHFDYAFLKRLSVQVGRTTTNSDYEFALKGTLLRPTESLPIAVGLRAGFDWLTASYLPEKKTAAFGQLLFSATLGDRVTIAAAPTYVQKTESQDDRVFNVPLILQVRITKSISAIGEYVPAKKGIVPDGVGQWSFGIEKGVYNHKFALRIGNSGGTQVDQIMAGDWFGGVRESNIRIGFNLIRQWDIGGK